MAAAAGTSDKLDINTEKLGSAAGQSTGTASSSALSPLPPPPPVVMSQLDAALIAMQATCDTLKLRVDAEHIAAATKQAAALTESPPVLQAGDVEDATHIEQSATVIPFPLPGLAPGVPG